MPVLSCALVTCQNGWFSPLPKGIDGGLNDTNSPVDDEDYILHDYKSIFMFCVQILLLFGQFSCIFKIKTFIPLQWSSIILISDLFNSACKKKSYTVLFILYFYFQGIKFLPKFPLSCPHQTNFQTTSQVIVTNFSALGTSA